MPDIAMCSGEACPRRNECYRARAVPSEFLQTYFKAPPAKPEGCTYFLRIRPGDQLTAAIAEPCVSRSRTHRRRAEARREVVNMTCGRTPMLPGGIKRCTRSACQVPLVRHFGTHRDTKELHKLREVAYEKLFKVVHK
jgi:hypothetical protein